MKLILAVFVLFSCFAESHAFAQSIFPKPLEALVVGDTEEIIYIEQIQSQGHFALLARTRKGKEGFNIRVYRGVSGHLKESKVATLSSTGLYSQTIGLEDGSIIVLPDPLSWSESTILDPALSSGQKILLARASLTLETPENILRILKALGIDPKDPTKSNPPASKSIRCHLLGS